MKMDEEEILDIILKNINELTCFDCGEKLLDAAGAGQEVPIGILWLDNGSCNYPREPDDPPTVYFECKRCMNESRKVQR